MPAKAQKATTKPNQVSKAAKSQPPNNPAGGVKGKKIVPFSNLEELYTASIIECASCYFYDSLKKKSPESGKKGSGIRGLYQVVWKFFQLNNIKRDYPSIKTHLHRTLEEKFLNPHVEKVSHTWELQADEQTLPQTPPQEHSYLASQLFGVKPDDQSQQECNSSSYAKDENLVDFDQESFPELRNFDQVSNRDEADAIFESDLINFDSFPMRDESSEDSTSTAESVLRTPGIKQSTSEDLKSLVNVLKEEFSADDFMCDKEIHSAKTGISDSSPRNSDSTSCNSNTGFSGVLSEAGSATNKTQKQNRLLKF